MENKNKFTPGPWYVHDRPQQGLSNYTIGDDETSVVAWASCRANARLISAAPDLLDALWFIVKAIKYGVSTQELNDSLKEAYAGKDNGSMLYAAELAIKKALGE